MDSLLIVLGGFAFLAWRVWNVTGNAKQIGDGLASSGFDAHFQRVGKAFSIDWRLLKAIAKHESGLNPNAIGRPNKNGTVDYGLMQINDRTAKTYGVATSALMNPEVSITIAARLLQSIKKELGAVFDLRHWIAAYNAGSPAIKSRGIFNTAYVDDVLRHYKSFGGDVSGSGSSSGAS